MATRARTKSERSPSPRVRSTHSSRTSSRKVRYVALLTCPKASMSLHRISMRFSCTALPSGRGVIPDEDDRNRARSSRRLTDAWPIVCRPDGGWRESVEPLTLSPIRGDVPASFSGGSTDDEEAPGPDHRRGFDDRARITGARRDPLALRESEPPAHHRFDGAGRP